MAAATSPQAAAGAQMHAQVASPADAEERQASSQQEAASSSPLKPSIEVPSNKTGEAKRHSQGENYINRVVSELYVYTRLQRTSDLRILKEEQPTIEHPKIWLPRALRQTYIRKVGDTVNLLIPFQGKPKPRVIWTHNGCELDTSRVSVRNGEQDSILFIREAQRADSGCYQLCVQLGALEATATIHILVVERPGAPQSIKLVDVWGSNATLEWTPPQDTGNTVLLGYTVQKADTKSGLWFTVLEHYHRTSCVVSDLIFGNSYAFRVFAENQCGLSETAPVTADLARIQKAALVYKTKGFAQRDFSEAPKFTQPLADCTTITGYDAQLFCCVRASPKPKIIWLKNKVDIQGNPKYRALSYLGICSLEIRKPAPVDGGVYTCKAINALGEASVDCRVDVKAPY